MDKEKDINIKKKKGFSLIELLAVIAIIGIISTIAFISVNNSINKSKNKIDEESEKMIIDASKFYSIEYRNTEEWFEGEIEENINEKKERKKYFCISLESLINSGYYKGDENKLKELKDKYFVHVELDENGVYSYNLIDKKEDKNMCLANESVSELNPYSGETDFKITTDNTKFGENGIINLGNLSYTIKNNDDGSYKLYTTFKSNELPKITETETNIKEFFETVTKEVEGEEEKAYVTLVLDKSGSMETRVNQLNTATVNIIDKFIENFDKTEVSIIEFADKLLNITDFSSTKKYKTTELSGIGSGTNISLGLVKALEKLKNKNGHKFIILFYDGQPTDTIYYTQNSKKYYPSYYDSDSKSYKRNDTFFNNYIGKDLTVETCKDYTGNTTVDFNTARCFYDFQKTTSYIKAKTDIEIITVLLPFHAWSSFSESIQNEYKQLSTIDNDLCNESDYFNKIVNQYNCYYESNNASVINDKFNIIFQGLSSKIKPKKIIKEEITWKEEVTTEETITFDEISKIDIKINLSQECQVNFSGYENIEGIKETDSGNLKSITYTMDLNKSTTIDDNFNFSLLPTCNIDNSETTKIDDEIILFKFEIIYLKNDGNTITKEVEGPKFKFKYSQFEAIN